MIFQQCIFTVLDTFDIENRRERKLKILNQNGIVIPPNLLEKVVSQYKLCAFFSIEIIFLDEKEPINIYEEVRIYKFDEIINILT